MSVIITFCANDSVLINSIGKYPSNKVPLCVYALTVTCPCIKKHNDLYIKSETVYSIGLLESATSGLFNFARIFQFILL